MAKSHNIFARLSRWASRQGENFLTEAFAIVLEALLSNEPEVACRFLDKFSNGLFQPTQSDMGSVCISTQTTTDSGRPDLEIRIAATTLIYVEVKDEAALGDRQLERYLHELARSDSEKTVLVFLSRYRVDETEIPDGVVHRRWFHVGDWLQNELDANTIRQDEVRFIGRQFLEFLQTKGLAMEKVEPIAPGASLRNLWEMLYEAAKQCGLKAKRSANWDWIGIVLDDERFYLGTPMGTPDQVQFSTGVFSVDLNAANEIRHGELIQSKWPKWSLGPYRWRNILDLSANDGEFYQLSASDQQEGLRLFLADSLNAARGIERPKVGPDNF